MPAASGLRTVVPAAAAVVVPFLLFLTVATAVQADPDLWGHLRFGADIAAARGLPAADAYSFTSDRAWVNHEWLAELLMHAAYAAGGAAGLVVLKLVLMGVMLAVVLRVFARHGAPPLLMHAAFWLAVAGTLIRTITVRPQLFSLVCFAVLLAVVTGAERGRVRALAWLVPVTVLWVNTHGGWIVGLGVLGVWTAWRLVARGVPRAERIATAAWGVAALLATLVNPYGEGLWAFLTETVRLGRPDIREWSPLTDVTLAAAAPWLLVFAAAIVALARSPHRPPYMHVAIAAALGLAAARVNRLDAFFALAVLILFAPQFVAAWRARGMPGASWRVAAPAPSTAAPLPTRSAPLPVTGVPVSSATAQDRAALVVLGVVVLAVAGMAAMTTAGQVTCIGLGARWLPEPEAAAFVRANRLEGRMVTWFDWGQYAIWHLSPAIRVSMDGRRETVYSEAWIREHFDFYRDLPSARDLPVRIGADYVWLPNTLPVVPALAAGGWTAIFAGPISTILARQPAGPLVEVPAPAVPRCFPGP